MTKDKNVRLKPNPDNPYACPECPYGQPTINEIRFESVNILADCTCDNCGFKFLQVLPVGHMVNHPLVIGKQNLKVYTSKNDPAWLSEGLLQSHIQRKKSNVPIEKIVYKECEKVVILNTLDSLYGHVLLKLYNAFYHLDYQPELGLILIIPKIFKWMIPDGCAEVWIVDLKLSELVFGYQSIRQFVSNEFNRFSEIQLSKAFSHPNLNLNDIKRLTGVAPFNLETFSQSDSVITFVLREDRWWHANTGDYWFYRLCRRLKKLKWAYRILSLRQNLLVKQTMNLISRQLPKAKFHVVGLGKTGGFKPFVYDERVGNVNAIIEKSWCEIYAKSHVVIGVHGSNMLLPTAHSAGCVEILPEDRYGNMIQDLTVRYNDRLQLFFYRFVEQYARPDAVSSKAIAMIRDYQQFNVNMSNITTQTGYDDGPIRG